MSDQQSVNLNVDFLRSGGEFRQPQTHESSGKAPVSQRPAGSPSRSRRLEEFYNRTIAAFQPGDFDAWDGMQATHDPVHHHHNNDNGDYAGAAVDEHGAGGPLVLNVDFLRSGAEFRQTAHPSTDGRAHHSGTGSGSGSFPSPRTTRAARLEAFHQQSLDAAAAAAPRPEPGAGADSSQPTIVNLDFLRGNAFASTTEAAPRMPEMPAGATPSPRSTRTERLEEFHRRSLEAAEEAAALDAWDGL